MGQASTTTIKRLFARSGDQCAFPGCTSTVIVGRSVIGDVCHIRADRAGGPRYDPAQSDVDRQSYDNLIVLCPTHHRVVDSDAVTYTVEVLKAMKRRHDAYAPTRSRLEIDDELAKRVQRKMMASAVAGALVGAAATAATMGSDIGSLLSWLEMYFRTSQDIRAQRSRAHTKLRDILRYGPTGRITTGSRDEAHKRLGVEIGEFFKQCGWVFDPGGVALQDPRTAEPHLAMLVTVKHRVQLPNAQRTVNQFLAAVGFEPIGPDGPLVRRERGNETARIVTIYGTHS